MKITDVCINGIENPIGYSYETISCSWKVVEAKGKKQKKAKIEVSTREDFERTVCCLESENLNSAGEELSFLLLPRTRYYVRVSVESDAGEKAESSGAFFETGKMDEPWLAQWIAAPSGETYHPILKKTFRIQEKVSAARLYITGVGLFEAYLDGKKIGNECLTPYITDYEKRIQVITLPIEKEDLCVGAHILSILLGKGWYMGDFGLAHTENNYGSRMAALAELHLAYENNWREVIGTDESWVCCGSDIEDSGIYFGEILNRERWKGKENVDQSVAVLTNPQEHEETRNLDNRHLTDRLSLPVKEKETLSVQEVIHTPADETVLDMGQNFAGWMEFKANLPAGTKIVLDFGEILQQGNFYNQNYRKAKSQFVYVSCGQEELVRPHFTFFGFRYVRVSGWPGELNPDDFKGKVLYSDLQRTGTMASGNAKINRLYENTLWGLKSNFIDMPTDCPQRDERLGWTGDAQVFAPTASYHMDTRAFYHKFIQDLREEQMRLSGGMPNYLPNFGHTEKAGSIWGDIATFLPYTLYTYYGSCSELEYCYPMMKDWVDFIDRGDTARGKKTYLFDFLDTFGDWLALDGPMQTSMKGSTDDTYLSSVYYYRSAQIVSEAATRLGKTEDAAKYADLAGKIKEAVLKEYFTPSGRLSIDTQAAYVTALKFGLYIDREKLILQFKTRLKKDLYQIKCGFAGAPILCTVLAEVGETGLAYDFLLKEEFPGWLYSVNLGATTIWERWNSVLEDGTISGTGMNSLNHYSYGSVMEFMYAYAAGIRPKEAGFRKAIIAPHPDIRLRYLSCDYDSVCGTYHCDWAIEKDGTLSVHIGVPFGCTAQVVLPEYADGEMTLEAGNYAFSYVPVKDFRKPYSKDTTLGRLARDEQAMAILGKYTPALAGIAASKDPELSADSLEELSKKGYLPFSQDGLKQATKEISEIIVE